MLDSSKRHNIKILIVDDDDFMREVVREALATLGVTQVFDAEDGRSALRWLRAATSAPDLIITDIYMPDMDGFELITALVDRKYSGKVLLCSGLSLENLALAGDVATGLGVNLVGVTPKPLSAEFLETVLDKL